MPTVSCQPNEVDAIFDVRNIRRCQRYVRSIQRKLDRAVANGDKAKIRWYIHLLCKVSTAAKVVAVWKITTLNSGKKTAGVDGVAMPKAASVATQNQIRLNLFGQLNVTNKPQPIRRVLIDKSNGKKRPLGIPTLVDRIHQELIRCAIEPIVEYHFLSCSYGFRPKRSCQDAVADLFNKLSHKGSRRWIVEGDISGCFDTISHAHIQNQLLAYNVPMGITKVIGQMLVSQIFHNGEIYDTESGTPQGGVLSPLLANVALTTLDQFCTRFSWQYKADGLTHTVNPIVRYADDFAVVCRTELEAKSIKHQIATHLSATVGVELSDEKTCMTHISKGFSFLGFHFRKYNRLHRGKRLSKRKNQPPSKNRWVNYVLLVKPQREKIANCKKKIKSVLKRNKANTQAAVIHQLNATLRGWGNYYRHVVSKEAFRAIDYDTFYKCLRWGLRRHPNKSKRWVINRYFSRQRTWKLAFIDRSDARRPSVVKLTEIPIQRHLKVSWKYRVYDGNEQARAYWQRREYFKTLYTTEIGAVAARLFRQQKGLCAWCATWLNSEDTASGNSEVHHLKPRQFGGIHQLRNLRLLHTECHRMVHRLFPRSQMAALMDKGIDYLRRLKGKFIVEEGESVVR